MADSTIEVTPGSGEEVAFSSLGGALGKAQVVKVDVAADGASAALAQPLTDTQIRATALPVSGTFFQATQPVSGTFWQATQPVSGTFWQATQPVSGTFWQATQPVSGPLTDAQLRAVAVPVSGTVTMTGGLTDAELRATAVPVSGTVAVTHAALTELGAAINASSQLDVNIAASGATLTVASHAVTNAGTFAVQAAQSGTWTVTGAGGTFPVTGTFWQATQPVSGTFWQATQPISAAALPLPSGASTEAKQPALGTAGTASTDVITIQGIASGTVVPVSDGGASLTVDGTFWQATQPVSGTVELGAAALAALETITVASVTAAIPAGTNNIGDVDVLTIAAGDNNIGNVDIVTLPNVVIGSGTVTTVTTVTTVASVTAIANALPAGTNAIGKLAANSGVDIGDVDVTSLPATPAGTNLIGRISASDETSTIYNATTALTPKFAIIDAASSGDNTLVAAVNPKKLRVHQLFLIATAAVNARFESGAGGTALSGVMNLAANGGFVLPYSPVGWFETASNTLLNLELSGAVSVDGALVYTEV